MSKQINLTLAKSGDVAVLRNEQQMEIVAIQNCQKDTTYIRFKYNLSSKAYLNDGTRQLAWLIDPRQNILDILRGGVSIFEPIQNDKP